MGSPRLTYNKMAGFATTYGQQYEVNLASLLFLRGLNSGQDFQLGTNVDGAGALDDVVFQLKPSEDVAEWTTLFVQLKHKTRKSISRQLLTNPSGSFSLANYFTSYNLIKQAMTSEGRDVLFEGSFDKSVFVIFTNAPGNNLLGRDRSGDLEGVEEFLWSGTGKVYSFEEDEDILKCLGDCGDERGAFLHRLRVFCDQPKADSLRTAVEAELRKVDKEIIRDVDFQNVLDCFLGNMKNWCEKSNDILHRGNDLLRASILEVTSQQMRKDLLLDLEFEEDSLQPFRDALSGEHRVLNINSSEESCRLTLVKLLQALEGMALVLNSQSLLANKITLLSQWRKGDSKSVIILTYDWRDDSSNDVGEIIKEMLAIQATSTFLFLNSGVFEPLACEFHDLVKSYKDVFIFSELNPQTREKLLARSITLQGNRSTISEKFKDKDQTVVTYLDACSVVEVSTTTSELILGSALGQGIGYYVDRSLELSTVVKASVLQDGSLRETVTIRVMLSGSSGQTKREEKESVSTNNSETAFIEKTISFLSSLLESSRQVKEDTVINNIAHCPLVPDEGGVAVGPTILLGAFECYPVAENNTVTALRVHTSQNSTQEACFIFVSEESDVEKMSARHKSKHLLSLENGQLRWVQSSGDVGFIRGHIDDSEKEVTKIRPRSVMDFEDRLVLVCAEPGMGKSTLMARLAENSSIQAEVKDNLVIFISLNDHSELFSQNKHKDVLKFLCSANNIESHLHRSLLKFALEVSGNVVVLFDGYDEIAQRYGEQCCDLVTRILEQTKVRKIWITSRNTFKNQLETTFSKFALRLCKFDKADQKSFLIMFWKEKSKLFCQTEELEKFIDGLLEKTSNAVRDKERNLMGIPLQTQMLAEVYEDHVMSDPDRRAKLPDTLDLLVLLEQFVEKKCSIYVQEKFKIEESKVANYEELYDILKSVFVYRHMKAALGLILDEDIIKSLHMEAIIKESSQFFKKIEGGKDKTGFIDDIVNGKPRFIHRVFAEYFVAKWVSDHTAGNTKLIESKMFTDEFTVVRNLFDRSLAKDCVLHNAVLKEDVEEVRKLLESEDINTKDGGGRTALHLAAGFGTSDNREENERRGEILDLLISKTDNFDQIDNVLSSSSLKYADLTKSWIAIDKFLCHTNNKEVFPLTANNVTNKEMLDVIFQFDLHNLLGFCLDNGMPAEHSSKAKRQLLLRACEKGNLKIATLLIERKANINIVNEEEAPEDKDSIKKKLEYPTPLQMTSEHGHIEITKLLLCKYASTLTEAIDQTEANLPSVSEYINIKDEEGKTAMHKAARHGYADLIAMLIDHGGDPQSKTNNSATPLHFAAQYKHPGALKVLLEALNEADRTVAINHRDEDGDTVLGCSAWGGSLECVNLVLKAGGTISSVGLANPFNYNSPGKFTTPLHRAALKRHLGVLRVLLESLDDADRTVAVNICDNDGDNVLSCAAWGGSLECYNLVVQAGGTLTSPGSSGETFHNLQENNEIHEKKVPMTVNRTTPFHRAALKKHLKVLRVLLEPLDEAGRTAAVQERDNDGDDVLYNAAWGGCIECVKLVIECGGKLTSSSVTPLMATARRGNFEVASYLLTNFDPSREGMNKLDFINLRNKCGRSAIYMAASNGHANIVSLLIGEGGDPLFRNNHNTSLLHIAAENRHPGVVKIVLEALDETERAVTVNSCDLDGENALMCAALGGCVECVELLLQAGGTMTTFGRGGEALMIALANKGSKVILSYLLKHFNSRMEDVNGDLIEFLNGLADNKIRTLETGSSLLHGAARNQHRDTLKILLDSLKEEDRAVAVNECDEDGNNVLFSAASGDCVDCIDLVIKAGGKFCQLNNQGRTPLMHAGVKNNESAVRYLLRVFGREREGVSKLEFIDLRDKDGKNAFDLARPKCRRVIENCRVRLAEDNEVNISL